LNTLLRSRRRRTVVGGAVLALALGGLAAALPAQASVSPSAASAHAGIASASATSIPISGGSPPHGTSIPISGGPSSQLLTFSPPPIVSKAVITDSLSSGSVTAPDAILTCATSQISVGGTVALAIPVGCLTLYNGEWVKLSWLYVGGYMELAQQTDGNLVLTFVTGTTTTLWSSGTTFKGNSGGPGCLAQFQSSANLVVSNCDGTSIWNSATHPYPNAVLALQADHNVVIYETSAGTALWSTNTSDS
jgi:hypothetical protein